MTNHLATCALLISLIFGLGSADPAWAATTERNPNSRGTAKKVVGIVLIPVGAVSGSLMLLVGAVNNCDGGTDACKKEARDNGHFYRAIGASLVVGGVVGGVLLINSASESRERWQQWEDSHKAASASANDGTGAVPLIQVYPYASAKPRGASEFGFGLTVGID